VDEELVSRAEVEALLFNVSDIAVGIVEIVELLGGGDAEEGNES